VIPDRRADGAAANLQTALVFATPASSQRAEDAGGVHRGLALLVAGALVVLRSTAKTDLVRAIAYLTWPALLAPVIAPALGGLLSTYASWRWIFVINVPLGVAGLLLAWRLVPDVRATGWAGWTGVASPSPHPGSRRWCWASRTSAPRSRTGRWW
jgi:MFS family permease